MRRNKIELLGKGKRLAWLATGIRDKHFQARLSKLISLEMNLFEILVCFVKLKIQKIGKSKTRIAQGCNVKRLFKVLRDHQSRNLQLIECTDCKVAKNSQFWRLLSASTLLIRNISMISDNYFNDHAIICAVIEIIEVKHGNIRDAIKIRKLFCVLKYLHDFTKR